MPTSIRMREDDVIEFANPMRCETVGIAEIEAIVERRRGRKGGEVVVRHARGQVRMLNWFKDLDGFIRQARQRNPDITRN
jgi:hypothetical protein